MLAVKVKRGKKRLWTALKTEWFLERALGLMFQRKAFPLVFEFAQEGTRLNSIHSLFCPPFDAIFLNSRKQVVTVMKNVKPFQLLLYSSKPAKFLIELPPGESRKTRVGDELYW